MSSLILQCLDLNECESNPCGAGAKCINQYGGYLCECPVGAKGDPYTGCGVLDLCQSSPCGLNARCHSEGGTYRSVVNHHELSLHLPFRCECPQGFEGNPRQQCLGENGLLIKRLSFSLIVMI